MKNITLITFCFLALAGPAFAQDYGDHGQIGAFAEYYRLQQAPRDLFGAGARLGFNVHKNVQLEAEMSYDFERGFGEGFQRTGSTTTSFSRSNLRALHGLFGPKLQVGKMGWLSSRVFVTAKGGFVNFGFSDVTSPAAGFTSQLSQLRSSNNKNGVFYPGGGWEGYIGPVGLRLDVGDEIFFNNGANHNLKVTFGPHIRF